MRQAAKRRQAMRRCRMPASLPCTPQRTGAAAPVLQAGQCWCLSTVSTRRARVRLPGGLRRRC
eukprot:59598-Rhodomonas_salina.2